jgi:hypothetical protein
MKIYSIYKLIDPNTLDVRYIGVTTTSLNIRLAQHVYDGRHKSGTHKINWIKALLENNQRPIIELLETTDEDNWQRREIYWINFYQQLTNTLEGGMGVVVDRSKSSVQKSSEAKYVKVCQLKEDGTFIKEWDSPTLASLKLDISKTAINNCLNKRVVLAGDFRWVYYEEYHSSDFKLRERRLPFGSKTVYKFNENMELINVYKTVVEAANANHLFHTSIRKSCKLLTLCNGFYYRFHNYDIV